VVASCGDPERPLPRLTSVTTISGDEGGRAAVVQVLRSVYDGMIAHALEDRPHECCGLLAGKNGVITRQFRATNVAENKNVRYEVDGAEVIRILHEIEEAEMEHLGIYHSHPRSEGYPSATDRRLAAYDVVYFVVGLSGGVTPQTGAYRIHKDDVEEQGIVVAEPVEIV
jgi:proteasome lid subunit RPN8/RPN11